MFPVSHFHATSYLRRALINRTTLACFATQKNNVSGAFRPRRRTPKAITKGASAKVRSKKSPKPTPIRDGGTSSTNETMPSNTDLKEIFSPDVAEAIRYLKRAQSERGSPVRLPTHETSLKAADYFASPRGTTEDLVGTRRASMDVALEDRESTMDELNALVNEERDKQWNILNNDEIEDKEWDDPEASAEDIEESEKLDPNQKAFGPWGETVIRVDRVQKVLRGGTMVRFRALVIGGNTNGCAGFGVAKAKAPNEATAAAIRMAKRNIFFVDRYMNSGLTSDLAGKNNSCRVLLRSVRPHRGLKGHPLVMEILKYFGISDCTAKTHGNRNIYNVVRATFKAICTHESMEEIAMKRGKRLMNLERAKRLLI